MPVMDGLASTRHIRDFEVQNNLPPCTIIVLTGLGSASMRQEAYSSGANLVLVKPVKLGELGAILDGTRTDKG
jgi:CheY-like chemotaxis protein